MFFFCRFVASTLMAFARIPQHIHSVQRECKHLESSAGVPLVLLAGRERHGNGSSVCRGDTRGLCDLFNRTLLLSGKSHKYMKGHTLNIFNINTYNLSVSLFCFFIFVIRCACCALWATTCSVATALRKRVAAGLRWIMLEYLWGFWDVMCLESSMPSTATVYDLSPLSGIQRRGFSVFKLFYT